MARGISTGGDVLKTTVDGVDLPRTIWTQFQQTLRIKNDDRDNLLALFGFKRTCCSTSATWS